MITGESCVGEQIDDLCALIIPDNALLIVDERTQPRCGWNPLSRIFLGLKQPQALGRHRFAVKPAPAFCLLPSAFCLLPSAFCLLPSAFCLLPSEIYQQIIKLLLGQFLSKNLDFDLGNSPELEVKNAN
jgi:hypothetical protein